MGQQILPRIKALAGKINWGEYYTLFLIAFGIPGLVWLWNDFKIAISVFVALQVGLGLLRLRSAE